MVAEAEKPERLRITVFLQHNLEAKEDAKLYEAVKKFIEREKEKMSGVEFIIEAVDYKEAKNCYYARYRLHKHYSNETYQL